MKYLFILMLGLVACGKSYRVRSCEILYCSACDVYRHEYNVHTEIVSLDAGLAVGDTVINDGDHLEIIQSMAK